ncbi:DUF6933 domain-containing protein [Mycolicibacterium poriferae]
MLRCTARVLALLGVSEPAIGEACATDWYAHMVWIDRRKCLLVTHAGTLFSVFMPNVTAAGLAPDRPAGRLGDPGRAARRRPARGYAGRS